MTTDGTPMSLLGVGKLIHLHYLDLSRNYSIRRLPESLCDLHNLQSLILQKCNLEELPNNIDKLINLYYLDLAYNYNIRRLPESLCDMYNMQTLTLYGCDNLESLRHGMIKLINLRKLDRLDKFIDKITKIGKLTSLQNLSVFKVLKDNGHKLIELNGLKQLRGGLCITNLENVENKDETNIASLNSKEDLDELELEWTSLQEFDSDVNLHISEQVLEGLQSHHNLQSLTIRGYNGARPPNWLHEQVYSRLETLQLQNCKNWNDLVVVRQLSQIKHLCLVRIPVQTQNLHNLFNPEHCKFFSQLEELVLEGIIMLEDLPNLGQLPCLKSLSIQSLPGVKMIGDRFFATTEEGSCFPRLHSLSFHEMPAWEEFHFSNDRNLFPCLVLLHISNCQKLLMLPRLPPSITCLQLKNVGLEDCPRFWKAIDEGSSITNSASVTELYI
ncbi:putative disease resistance protein RGA1 [Zingiber officinale]|uniref:putative disease resistance protein RGA1 n=1 Tax=Zingiber officinale TaxID=94328 RepID=UPI001C4B73B9|nr:putative disease resistance protein RGA1 [Zingiber officinale]